MGQTWAELPIFPKREYFDKFKCYIFVSVAPHYVSRVINIGRVDHEIWSYINLRQFDLAVCPIRSFFGGKMTVTFCWSFVSYHATEHLKKIIRVDHDTECCKKMGKLGSKLLIYPKREFFLKNNYHHLCLSSTPKFGPNCSFASLWQNWLLLLSTYCILSCYSISKKSWTSNSWTEGVQKVGPNWVQVISPKGTFSQIFWKRWPTLLSPNYCISSGYAISKKLSQCWLCEGCIIFTWIAPSVERKFV